MKVKKNILAPWLFYLESASARTPPWNCSTCQNSLKLQLDFSRKEVMLQEQVGGREVRQDGPGLN